MGRVPCCDKEGLKKGPWTREEDQKLLDYIQKHGPGRWRTLSKNAGLNRCGKSCRLRWTNYLRPDIKRGRFTPQEEEAIIQLHYVLGNKWSAIAARLAGRTDNEIKNYWNTHIKKKLLRMGIDPATHSPCHNLLKLSSLLSSSQLNLQNLLGPASLLDPNLLNLANALVSSQLSNPELSVQELEESQLGHNTQFVQNQLTSSQPNQTPSCTTPNTSGAQLLDHVTQPTEAKMEPSCSSVENAMSSQNYLSDFLQNHEVIPSLEDCRSYDCDPSTINTTAANLNFPSGNKDDLPNMNFSSLLSTPTSTLIALNSLSATHVGGSSNEEGRDSYCSDMLFFDMQHGLNSHGIM